MNDPARSLARLLIGLLAFPALTSAASPEQLLDEAVHEYRAALDSTDGDERIEKFRRAELLFARLVDGNPANPADGIRNADLYVNLGNAAMGAKRLGPAILAYRRALDLDPDHHRARQNLAHARTLLPDWIPRPEEGGLLDTFFAWTGRLSLGEFQTLAAFAFLATAALIAAAIRWRQPILRNLAIIPGLVWLTLLGTILFLHFENRDTGAVLTLPEVVARSADSAGAAPRFPQPLPGGTEVQVLETRDDWTRVRLFDGRDAWLPRSAVETVVEQPNQ
jgi:tetratricopeptide (TPR) repeat protein